MEKCLGWIHLQPTGKCDGHGHNLARAAHFFLHIFAAIARPRRERFIEDVNTTTTISLSFFLNLGAAPRIQPQRNSPTYDILSELEEAAFCSSFYLFCPLSLSISAT